MRRERRRSWTARVVAMVREGMAVRGGVGGVVDGKTEVGVWGRYPGAIEATGSVGLIVGGNEGSG